MTFAKSKASILGRLVGGLQRWQARQEANARDRAERIAAFHEEAERLYRVSMNPLTQAELDEVVTRNGREAAMKFLDARLKGKIVDIARQANDRFRFGIPTFSAVCRFLQELDMAGIKNMHGFELVGWSESGRVIQDSIKLRAQRERRELESTIERAVRRSRH